MASIIDLNKVVHVIDPEEYELPEPALVLAADPVKYYCDHPQVEIWEHYRLVKCRRCGRTLDAFNFLVEKGKQEKCHFSNLKWLKHEIKQVEENKETLKKEIAKLKAEKRKLL